MADPARQIASSPVSPVRMRIASSMFETKILPSPMRPVWAARGSPRRPFDHVVGEHDLDLHLGQEVDDVFGAAIEFGMALLAAEALGLGDGDALQADFLQRFLHLVELERLDDGLDLLHRAAAADRGDQRGGRPGRSPSTCPAASTAPAASVMGVAVRASRHGHVLPAQARPSAAIPAGCTAGRSRSPTSASGHGD
jgi:hypothetical protein